MTKAVCKQLVNDLLDAGAQVTIYTVGPNNFAVHASTVNGPIDQQQVAALASRYSVASQTTQAEFS